MASVEDAVYEILNSLNISYITHNHPPVSTVEEAKEFAKNIPGAHCKNLFLKDSKNGKYYLAVILDHKKVNLKSLANLVGASRFSFASEENLYEYLGLRPGAVSAFGIINDAKDQVVVLVDRELKKWDKVSFHPNVNTSTLTISCEDFEKFLGWSGNEIQWVEIEEDK